MFGELSIEIRLWERIREDWELGLMKREASMSVEFTGGRERAAHKR